MTGERWRSAVVLALLVSGASCGKAKPEAAADEELPAVTVTCAAVARQSISDELTVRGVVAPPPSADAVLSSLIPGRVSGLAVDVGDQVKVGQVVARVEDPALAAGTREAQAAIGSAQAELTIAGLARARVQKLVDGGIAARRDLDDAIARDDTARANLAAARARASAATGAAARAVVRAPRAGIVLRVFRRTGEAVDGTPATPILELADVHVLELRADVSAASLVRLTAGAAATVTLDALSDRPLAGTLVMVAPAIDPATGLGEVRIALAPPPEGTRLIVGLTGVAVVALGARDGLVVPLAALRRSPGGGEEVVVCAGDPLAAAIKEVTVGHRGATTAEIVDGLAAGDRIVVDHALGLADEQPLLAPAAPAPAASGPAPGGASGAK